MTTKTDRFLKALKTGNEISPAQAVSRYGFESPQAVGSAVRNLRESGYAVYTNKRVNGKTTYRIGTPTRRMVATAYRVLGANALA